MKSILPILALFVLVNFGCTKDEDELSHNLRLRYKGADMPIWVRGNAASDRMVLFLHGGPGAALYVLEDIF